MNYCQNKLHFFFMSFSNPFLLIHPCYFTTNILTNMSYPIFFLVCLYMFFFFITSYIIWLQFLSLMCGYEELLFFLRHIGSLQMRKPTKKVHCQIKEDRILHGILIYETDCSLLKLL